MRVVPDFDQGRIRGLLDAGKSVDEVAKITKRSRAFVKRISLAPLGPLRHRSFRNRKRDKGIAKRRALVKRSVKNLPVLVCHLYCFPSFSQVCFGEAQPGRP